MNSSGLLKNLGRNKFFYFNDNTPEYSLLIKPYKKNVGRNIYWINHKLYTSDTIDVNIGGWTIETASRKELGLAAWCGGDMGYIPDERFIFNKFNGTWVTVTSKEIIDQRVNEEKAKLKNE